MVKKAIALVCAGLIGVCGLQAVHAEEKGEKPVENEAASDATYELKAYFETSKGTMVVKLFPDKAPVTVASFVNLCRRGFYDGLKFHRVIAKFMIQGGDPEGTGSGGPGYRFEDEFDPSLRFDRKALLAMANSGPGTNGSQFFITHVPTPHLNNKHTIFGEVVEGQDVVDSIAKNDSMDSVKVKGDVEAFLASQKKRVDEWNAVLDK